MAVYTKLTLDDLTPILERYDIGEPLSLTPIAEGTANTNYMFATTTGRYVCTLFERPEEAAQMSWLPQFLEYLNNKGQNVITYLPDTTGSFVQYIGKKVCVISYYLRGEHGKQTAKHAEKAGATLANLHIASEGYAAPVAQAWAAEAHQAFAKKLTCTEHPMYKKLYAEPAWQVSNQESRLNLPQGVTHADFFPDNVLFEGGYVSGVIDFNLAGLDAFAFDLAMALTAWGFDTDGKHLPAVFKGFYKGYTNVRPLTAKEAAAMPELCRRACCAIMTMRLQCLEQDADGEHNEDHHEGPRPPEAYGKRLEFFQDDKNIKELNF